MDNMDIERAVLAGICQFGKDAFYDVSDIVKTSSFLSENNQALYKCLESIIESNLEIDAASIASKSKLLGVDSIVNLKEVKDLFSYSVKLNNVRNFAKQIAKIDFIKKASSTLLSSHNELRKLNGTESIDHIISIPENAVFSLINSLNGTNESKLKLLGDGTKDRIKTLMENPVEMLGIPTPWPIYNSAIGGGIRPGVAMIGARPKTGKSSIALNMALHVTKNLNIPVLYLDTEMTQNEQEIRAVSNISKIPINEIETGKVKLKKAVLNASDELSKLKIYHEWVGGKLFEEILSIARRWIYAVVGFDEFGNTNPHMIIYDYFKLMNSSPLDKMQEYQAIGFQISSLSDFCKHYNTPCLATVQTNRDGISKETSDVVSMSDRLLWLCTSLSIFKRKEPEEIVEDGRVSGNRKLSVIETRFGSGLDIGNYINMEFDGGICSLKEVSTKFASESAKKEEGFVIEDASELSETNQNSFLF